MSSNDELLYQQQSFRQKLIDSFKSIKLLTVIVTVLFVTIAAGKRGYLLGTRTSHISPQAEIIFQPSPTIVQSSMATPPTSSTQATTTSSWKTYNHPDGFYIIKYPPSLIYKEEGIKPNSACKTELILANKTTGFSDRYQGDIVINVCKIDKQYFEEVAFGNIEGSKIQPVILDGKQGLLRIGTATFHKLESITKVKTLAFYENDILYIIDLRYIPGNPNLDQVFNDILSTFKFHD